MLQELDKAYHWRYNQDCELNLQSLATNDYFTERFLDDISNSYDRYKITLPKFCVD
jgi:hypothetical protein